MAITLLTINDRRGVGSFAQGGIYREYVMITADAPLTAGNCIRVSPALFDGTFQADQVLPKKYHWKLIYSATGEFTMAPPSFVIDKYKNVIIKIKFFTDSIFEVKFEWMAVADTLKYLNPYPYQPIQLWTNQTVDKLKKAHVYNSADKLLGLRITVDVADTDPPENLAFIQSDYPVQGKVWTLINYPSTDNKFFYEVNGSPVDGFVLGEDLVVKLRNFPRYTNCQYYAGIFRTDTEAFVNGAFYDELFMQYAKANNTADEPFLLTTNVIDRNQLKNMYGFRYDQAESIAEFTVDADYFETGGKYRAFLITVEECKFQSYLFDEFGEKTPWLSPEASVTVTELIVDGIPIDIAFGNCLFNVPTGAEIQITFRFDIPLYEADVVAKGLPPNTYLDYFKDYDCYISNGSNQLGSHVTDQTIEYASDDTVEATLTYSFKVPKDWAGTNKYINAEWAFDYGNGQIDHLASFVHMDIVDDASIAISSPDPLPESYCEADAIEREFCFESLDATPEHKLFIDLINEGQTIPSEDVITQDELDFSTDNDACVSLDYTLIGTNQEYCIDLRAWKATNDSVDRPCTRIKIHRNKLLTNGTIYNWDFGYEIEGKVDADIKFVGIVVTDINDVPVTQNNNNGQFNGDFFTKDKASNSFLLTLISAFTFKLSIYILDKDGNVYYISPVYFTWNYQTDTNETYYDICTGVTEKYCEENPVLSSTIVWNYAVPAGLSTKTITAVETNFGAAAVTKYKIINGAETAYTAPFTTGAFNTVALRFVLDYGGGCELELYECLTEQEASIP